MQYPNKEFKFWGRSGMCPHCKIECAEETCSKCHKHVVRNKCTACSLQNHRDTACSEGSCFFCYGQDRWQHMCNLRSLLDSAGMWDKKKRAVKEAPSESNGNKVPLASTLHIACPSLTDKKNGEELLEKLESVLKVGN